MKKEDLEHILRAASAITKQTRFIVIGSQSIVAFIPDPPGVLGYSTEADIYPLDAPELAELIDGSIGEGSPFHNTFGYYAQGVGPETAVLPKGWEHRLTAVRDPITLADGFCLDPTDMAASKIIAWREKDKKFLVALLRQGIIQLSTLTERVAQIPKKQILQYQLTQKELSLRISYLEHVLLGTSS
jgi:hypothetical protein